MTFYRLERRPEYQNLTFVFGEKSRSWDGPGSHKNELGLHVH